jgi:hypothetical protein
MFRSLSLLGLAVIAVAAVALTTNPRLVKQSRPAPRLPSFSDEDQVVARTTTTNRLCRARFSLN